jgi:hypothetical protein
MNEQKRKSDIRKLVANARAIISYQVGLPFGCIKMRKILIWIENEDKEAAKFPVFEEYLRAAIDLPIGPERLQCSREALRRYDQRLVTINLRYREEVINACFEIIERYGESEMG